MVDDDDNDDDCGDIMALEGLWYAMGYASNNKVFCDTGRRGGQLGLRDISKSP